MRHFITLSRAVSLTVCVAGLLAGGCSAVAAQVPRGQTTVAPDQGVAMGRLSFIARRKIAVERFELTAVQVPDGKKFLIQFTPDGAPEDGDGGSFFVSLPPGQYRLTEWVATGKNQQWSGEDIGLAMEVMSETVVCVGALFVKPLERQKFSLVEQPISGDTVVRDECPALTELLRQRSPALAEAPVVRIARRVDRRASRGGV
jgi:hypothetical protein